jgi:hypothetical protein
LNVLDRYVSLDLLSQISNQMHRSLPLLLIAIALTGCLHRSRRANPYATGPRQATVEWLGHGCLRITSAIGLSLLIDPFDPAKANSRIKVASVPADAIFITHEDALANYTDLASGSPQIFRSSMASGVNRASGILVRGVRTSSENLNVTGRVNIAYAWAMDGVRFCDLGQIEDAITTSEALNIGNVDVLFIPTGGNPAFTDEKRRITLARLQPRVIVPISYTGGAGWGFRGARVVRLGSNRFTISPSALPAEPTVYLFGG